MNLNKVLLAERRKVDTVMGFVIIGVLAAIMIGVIIGVDFKSLYEEELIAMIVLCVIVVAGLVFCVFLIIKTPKNLIIYDKEKQELEIHAGQSIPQQMKTVTIKVSEISNVSYVKPEFKYYVVVSTHRVGYISIILKNGKSLFVTGMKKPKDVEEALLRLMLENKEEEN